MASAEVFCNNVKTLLAQRNIRMKDLAEGIGLSESYLSLVLNGSRKNLNDEYKDRIAALLNVTVSQLYSMELGAIMAGTEPVFPEDPDRRETVQTVETFLKTANLTDSRAPFLAALASLDDEDARIVRRFFSGVLKEMTPRAALSSIASAVLSLSDAERTLLTIYLLAGQGARLEWTKVAADLDNAEFEAITAVLVKANLLRVVTDEDTRRSSPVPLSLDPSAQFTQRRLRELHLSLAGAMSTYSDEGEAFEKQLAEHFLRAGRNAEAWVHLRKAAQLLEQSKQWRDAAEVWHQASIVCAVLDDNANRGNCLAEAAKCLCVNGQFEEANDFGSYACRLSEELGQPRAVTNICIMMGNMLFRHDPRAAEDWYRRGLKVAELEDPDRGTLLGNLASSLMEAGKFDEAENVLREARRWSSGRSGADVGSLRVKVPIGLGLIEYRRRNWKRAKEHFETAVALTEGEQAPADTALHNLGTLAYRDDDMKTAAEFLVRAQDLYSQRGEKVSWAYAAIELAKIAIRTGDWSEATRHVKSSESYIDDKPTVARGWINLVKACIDRAQERQTLAVESGGKAVDIFQRENAERELAVAALWLSDLYRETGDPQQAAFMERRAFQVYEKRHWDIRELHRERSLLEPQAG